MEIISFVILHYGDIAVTQTCVQSIMNLQQQERVRIVIVDNDIDKTENERELLLQRYADESRIKILQITKKGGFSYANNCGYRYARDTWNAAFIIVLNNDIEFIQQDFIQRLEQSYSSKKCHILGPDIICGRTGEHQNPMDTRVRTREEAEYTVRMNRMALKYYTLLYPMVRWKLKRDEKKRLAKKAEHSSYYESVQKEIVPFGACLIFTPKFVQKEKLAFTPETEFYYEEYILTSRCQKAGYDIVYDPIMKVLHENGATTKQKYKNKRKYLKFILVRTVEACEIYLKCLK